MTFPGLPLATLERGHRSDPSLADSHNSVNGFGKHHSFGYAESTSPRWVLGKVGFSP
jgi:hypothetical protein